jgi:sugar phosphate isomerase/epimerase
VRIAASNIAWDALEDQAVLALLRRYGVDAIDIAPTKYFADPAHTPERDVTQIRSWWAERGIEVTGMQALLFGTNGLNLFGASEVRAAMLVHLTAVCRIGQLLGARRLVFGSPRNRDRSGLSDEATLDIASEFFTRLAAIASAHEVLICLEPNPTRYGSNFMLNSAETAKIVEAVAQSTIRMQLDTGAVTINEEDPERVIPLLGRFVGHVHASEPDLVPLGDGGCDHASIARLVHRNLPEQVVSIEMVATKNEPHLVSLERALKVATHHYRSADEGASLGASWKQH